MFKIRMCCACPFCIKVIVYEPSIRDHSSRTMDVYVYVDKLGQCTVTGYWVSIDFWCSYTNQDSLIITAWSLTNQDIYVMTRRGEGIIQCISTARHDLQIHTVLLDIFTCLVLTLIPWLKMFHPVDPPAQTLRLPCRLNPNPTTALWCGDERSVYSVYIFIAIYSLSFWKKKKHHYFIQSMYMHVLRFYTGYNNGVAPAVSSDACNGVRYPITYHFLAHRKLLLERVSRQLERGWMERCQRLQ